MFLDISPRWGLYLLWAIVSQGFTLRYQYTTPTGLLKMFVCCYSTTSIIQSRRDVILVAQGEALLK